MTFVPGWDGPAFDRWLTSQPDDNELTDEQARHRDEADLEASRMLDEQAVHEQALNDDDAVWDALADQRTADEAAWHEAQTAEESEEMSQGPADRADT